MRHSRFSWTLLLGSTLILSTLGCEGSVELGRTGGSSLSGTNHKEGPAADGTAFIVLDDSGSRRLYQDAGVAPEPDQGEPLEPDSGTPPPPPPPPVCDWATVKCESVNAFPNCNTHLGDNEAACRAMGNPGGCSAEVLTAWCRRRVDPEPTNQWYQLHRKWVDDRCDGTISLAPAPGGHGDLYSCRDEAKCKTFSCQTPLVLVFALDQQVAYRADDGRGSFDFSAAQDGSGVRADWPTSATPWLAMDRNGDGLINSARELFGTATPLAGGEAHNGFEALSALDENGDAKIDAEDSGYHRLRLWYDTNGDRRSSPTELKSLRDVGVLSLGLLYAIDRRCDKGGNCEVEAATFTYRDASGTLRYGKLVDVHLKTRPRVRTPAQ